MLEEKDDLIQLLPMNVYKDSKEALKAWNKGKLFRIAGTGLTVTKSELQERLKDRRVFLFIDFPKTQDFLLLKKELKKSFSKAIKEFGAKAVLKSLLNNTK